MQSDSHLVKLDAADAGWREVAPAARALPPAPLGDGFCAPWVAAMHRDSGGMVGALGCWTVPDGTVGGRFLLGRDGRSLAGPGIAPEYISRALAEDALEDAPHRGGVALRRVDGTVAAIGTLGYETFGHWLIDILPRLWVLRRALGAAADTLRFAVPDDLPGFGQRLLAALGIGPERLLRYARGSEALCAETLLVPSLMHQDYRFHPLANRFYDGLVARLAPAGSGPARVLLSRGGWRGAAARRLVNEAELEAVLAPLGFVTVRPETLSWPEQIRLFASARVVVGEHGSAMKGLVFARPGTVVVNMHFLNMTQTHIANLRAHRLSYLDAETVATSSDGVVSYRIDPARLLACVAAALA